MIIPCEDGRNYCIIADWFLDEQLQICEALKKLPGDRAFALVPVGDGYYLIDVGEERELCRALERALQEKKKNVKEGG